MTQSIELNGGTYRFTDLLGPDGKIRDMTATEVHFIGPAVIGAAGILNFDDPTFEVGDGGIESIIWEIDPARSKVAGVIGLIDCSFVRCRFELIGLAIRPRDLPAFLATVRVNS